MVGYGFYSLANNCHCFWGVTQSSAGQHFAYHVSEALICALFGSPRNEDFAIKSATNFQRDDSNHIYKFSESFPTKSIASGIVTIVHKIVHAQIKRYSNEMMHQHQVIE